MFFMIQYHLTDLLIFKILSIFIKSFLKTSVLLVFVLLTDACSLKQLLGTILPLAGFNCLFLKTTSACLFNIRQYRFPAMPSEKFFLKLLSEDNIGLQEY